MRIWKKTLRQEDGVAREASLRPRRVQPESAFWLRHRFRVSDERVVRSFDVKDDPKFIEVKLGAFRASCVSAWLGRS